MSKYDKLIDRLKNNPKNIDFKVLKKILEENGYIGVNTGGSHWVFRKVNKESITIPYKKPIKIIKDKNYYISIEYDIIIDSLNESDGGGYFALTIKIYHLLWVMVKLKMKQ